MKIITTLIFSLIINYYCSSQLALPLSLRDIQSERGGTEPTISILEEAALWYAQTGKEKFNIASGNINLSDWVGESWATLSITLVQSASSSISLVFQAFGSGFIDWGDGESTNFSGYTIKSHEYTVQEEHTIKIYSIYGITSFIANNNSLIDVDFSLNSALEELELNNNNLTTLDVTNNTLLTNLKCENNNLSSINLTYNTLLEVFIGSDNNFTVLNIANNTELSTLTVGDCSLTSLFITGNTKLISVIVLGNSISTSHINTTLQLLDSYGLSNGVFRSEDQTPPAPPTGAGITSKDNLITKGWLLSTD